MDVYTFTSIGPSKDYNEDVILADLDRGILIQADGMSSRNGKESSMIAVDAAYDFLKKNQDATKKKQLPIEALRCAFLMAQRNLNYKMNNSSGTTLDIIVLKKNNVLLGHVGDSRVYLASEGKVHLLTKDHTDTIGMLENFVGGQSLHVDLKILYLRNNDVLTLCTDGVHKYASESVIKSAMLNLNSTSEEIGTKITNDVQAQNGEIKIATDNMSIIVYRHTRK